MIETTVHNQSPLQPSIEVGSEQFNAIMQPNEVLAAQVLDYSIQTAETDPQTSPEALALLHFQRSLVDMSPENARTAAIQFARQTGKYATFGNNGDGTLPGLDHTINRTHIIIESANAERWRILGINPGEQYGDDAYGNSYKLGIEESWREAREARQALAAAQIAEAEALDRIVNPPVFEPK